MRFALPLLALAACTGVVEDPTFSADTDPTIEGPGATATIELTSPADGSTSYSSVTLAYTVDGFILDAAALTGGDTTQVEGTGHVHILVDGTYVDHTAETTFTVNDLASGDHTIAVVLAGNDHTELTVMDETTVTVLVPAVAITSPADGALLDSQTAELTLAIDDFAMSEDVDGDPVLGEGHYHVLVDGKYSSLGTDATGVSVPKLEEGLRDITIELMYSDHTSLDPVVSATITVMVPPDVGGGGGGGGG